LLRGVWLPCKSFLFKYRGLVVIIVFLEYLKIHSNPKFCVRVDYSTCTLNTTVWDTLSMLTSFWRRQLLKRTSGGALWSGADGPWPGARRRCSLVRHGRSATQGRTVRDLVQELGLPAWRTDGPRPRAGRSARAQGRRRIAGGAWISLPGGTPSGSIDPRWCLGSGRRT
jgi:hypothetical protein